MRSITRVGIDTSKDTLDVYIDRRGNKRLKLSNDKSGIAQLKQELGGGDHLIAIEATGRYESLARHGLEASGHEVKVQNPRNVRRLADGLGVQAKTDRIDAKLLAHTAELCAPNKPRSKEREALGDLSRAIDCLKEDRSAHLKRIQVPGYSKIAAESLNRVIKALDRQIKRLSLEFEKLVAASSFAQKYEHLQSIPCIGPNTARVAVCELPEDIQNWSVRQISAYAGVAPMDDSSGKRTAPARVPKHGNFRMKAALYMPAMGWVKKGGWGLATYRRLLARGLTHQQAIIPLMHKQLFFICAVLKRGTAWEAVPPKGIDK
jgi:transposase